MRAACLLLIASICAAQSPMKIPDGTSVHVQLKQELSSQSIKNGDTIEFSVAEPVLVDGVEVIAAGAVATARIMGSQSAGHWSRDGRLAWVMESVTAVDGTSVPLRWIKELPEGGKGAKTISKAKTAGVVVAASPLILYYSPLIVASIPFVAKKKGQVDTIPAGERYLVFINGEVQIEAQP
jgi:hypothetical protein